MVVILIYILFGMHTAGCDKAVYETESEKQICLNVAIFKNKPWQNACYLRDQLECVILTESSLSGKSGLPRNDSGASGRNLQH